MEAHMRLMLLLFLLAGLLLVTLTIAQLASADGTCLTRDEAITLIAHKADIEHHEPAWVKARIWAIADRESGLTMCDERGRVKVSPTGDYGLLQMNPDGIYRNCKVNPHCKEPSLIDDPSVQVDVLLDYYDVFGDLCPWNPDGAYMPGCGYGRR
jgi:hypothetical protein